MIRSLKAVAAAAAALCLSLGLCAPTFAQSSVSIYGLLDASVGQMQNAGAVKDKRVDSGNMTTSFIGFSGQEDLGGGLKATFAIESFLRGDTGESGRFTGDTFWSRSAIVGLKGAFGSTAIGRNTNPFFVSTLIFNAFGDSFGFSPAIRQILIPSTGLNFLGDTGWSNSIAYSSPKFGGAGFNLIANTLDAGQAGNGKNFGGNVVYFGGPLSFTVAVQKVRNFSSTFGINPIILTGFQNQTSGQIGLAYDFSVVKLFAQAAKVKSNATVDTDTTILQIGAAVPLGGGKVLAQFGKADADFGGPEVTNKTLTLGYDYNLSKSTDLYAIYMNDRMTGLTNGNTVAAGIRLKF
jgi:predicted porin